MKAIVTVGVSASGKTTFAKEWSKASGARIICRDDVRALLVEQEYGLGGFSWARWNWKREKEVTAIFDSDIQIAANEKCDICIADTNLNIDRLRSLEAKLIALGYDVEIKYFDVTYEEAIKRDAARPNPVGAIVIGKQFAQLRSHQTAYQGGEGLPTAVICDIDGTLAHMNGKRGPYEWDKVHVDDVDEEIESIIQNFFDQGDEIIFLSGRDGAADAATEEWIDKHLPFVDYELWLRDAGDMRSDTIVKRELFDAHIRDKYNVRLVLDDRPKVCRMWRDLGLKVLQCGDPYVEF